MSIVAYQLHWLIPIRIKRAFLMEDGPHVVAVSYSVWLFRGRRFGKKREWADMS